jgi:type III secretory pathway component EscV
MGRIAGHTRGLVEDLREWMDLRIDLAILEVEEKVDDLRNEVALGITLAFLGFFAAMFVFTTIALGLGWLLGHPFWGFLIVSTLLVITAVALAQTRPELMPPSNLFEQIRGEAEEDAAEKNRPSREARATVEDAAEPDRSSSSS